MLTHRSTSWIYDSETHINTNVGELKGDEFLGLRNQGIHRKTEC